MFHTNNFFQDSYEIKEKILVMEICRNLTPYIFKCFNHNMLSPYQLLSLKMCYMGMNQKKKLKKVWLIIIILLIVIGAFLFILLKNSNKKIDNSFMATKIRVVDEFEKGNKTLVEISDISTKKIPSNIFTKAYLENLSK